MNTDMEQNKKIAEPDHTAVRTALWRALHVQIDSWPHIIEDEIGLKLVAPNDGWQQRPDMDPDFTRRVRVSIAARARFVEDLVIEQSKKGIDQYVILGAGLDTFAQRRPEIASRLQIFEIDQPDTQIWKQQRLIELGFGIPKWLRFVPVDFEADSSWWEKLKNSGFDTNKPAVIACTGVSMYLTQDAILAILRQVTRLAPDSKLAMTFLLPIELVDEEDQPLLQISIKGAQSSGTPFKSFFSPEEMLDQAKKQVLKRQKLYQKMILSKAILLTEQINSVPQAEKSF